MGNAGEHRRGVEPRAQHDVKDLPLPSAQFRLRAWREFQRALDPLAPPRPLPQPPPVARLH